MSFPKVKVLRAIAGLLAIVAIAGLAAGGWFYQQMRRSLPQLDGNAAVAGLSGAVTVTRDAIGVPTIKGGNRVDVARALGWLHAQERFFQMDLLRRRAAGELAALFGSKAVAVDKSARVFGFRHLARENLARLAPDERKLIEAYTAGVNAGLHALAREPFEYLVLRTTPQDWQAEDTILVVFAMGLELHDPGEYERSLAALRAVYGPAAVDFFAPLLTANDAALDGSRPGEAAPIPSAQSIDLRHPQETVRADAPLTDDATRAGSNSFALSGAHTASGVPLLANDMHLHLQVPNTWYRASLEWPAATAAEGKPADSHKVTGVTLPGVPLVIAGSNGHIAWGFTNAYADTADVVVIEPNIISRSLYKNGEALLEFTTRRETIAVKGSAPVNFEVSETVWGPIIGIGEKTRPLAYHWTTLLPGAVNLSLMGLESARTVAEALAVAHRSGIPAQNILIADDRGDIAWSIAGQLPQRVGYDGRLPVAWTYGDRYWDGMVAPGNVPVITNPASGRLWTANNRVLGEPGLSLLGDGGYDQPTRAARIRDRLAKLENATPVDLLALQLDDRSTKLDRWHELLLKTLTPEVTKAKRSRAKLRQEIENWDGHARIDAVSYRLVRLFRQQVANFALNPIFAPCSAQFAGFSWHRFHYEPALWTLLTEQPEHLLAPRFQTWDELLIAAADSVVEQIDDQGLRLAKATWGKRNHAKIEHPLARALPGWLAGWLNMPDDPLPGDTSTPRVQSPDFGASERMVVSPGREHEGIFHMPGGQSGHPLSPYYRAGHEAWVNGDPTPFLPGPTEHTLILQP